MMMFPLSRGKNVVIIYEMIRNSLFMTKCKLFRAVYTASCKGKAIRVSVCRGN